MGQASLHIYLPALKLENAVEVAVEVLSSRTADPRPLTSRHGGHCSQPTFATLRDKRARAKDDRRAVTAWSRRVQPEYAAAGRCD
jgi:hypothetical protein